MTGTTESSGLPMGSDNTPPKFSGTRTLVMDIVPGVRAQIAGRVRGGLLEDRTGAIRVEPTPGKDGAIVSVTGMTDNHSGAIFVADEVTTLAAAGKTLPRDIPSLRCLHARADLLGGIRAYFAAEDFVEVETPNLVHAPGTDLHLDPFRTEFSGMGEHRPRELWLHTSPEFAMKRLLVSGMERIYQICKVWRNGEWTERHHPEFTMVEWYRAYADWGPIMDDVERIVASALGLDRPFARLRVEEAFSRYAGVRLEQLTQGDGWEDDFHELLVTKVEPQLEGAVFLTHYPRALAVLSRVCDEDPRYAERFELYVDGVELCNGFTELTDPVEQRQRFAEEQRERMQRGVPQMPMPTGFLEALEAGMPPSGGVALGLDRLLMLQVGADELDAVLMR